MREKDGTPGKHGPAKKSTFSIYNLIFLFYTFFSQAKLEKLSLTGGSQWSVRKLQTSVIVLILAQSMVFAAIVSLITGPGESFRPVILMQKQKRLMTGPSDTTCPRRADSS